MFLLVWTHIGTGDMLSEGWENISNASSLPDAKAMMLNIPKFAVDGAILFYSNYSYVWGVRCGTPEMVKDRELSNNQNWHKYQLSYGNLY